VSEDQRWSWLWSLKRIADNGLGGPMFHRQSRMFLTYIRDRDPAAFRAFLQDLLDEKELVGPFRTHYGLGTQEMWQEFVASFDEAGSSGSGPLARAESAGG
jgi:hypothetical protein